MKYTSEDVSMLIDQVKGHEDVIGHCCPYVMTATTCYEDTHSGSNPAWKEDLGGR